jgi:acid phosphatase (class A)
MSKLRSFAWVVCTFLPASALAHDANQTFKFLDAKTIPGSDAVKPVPQPDSPTEKRDVKELLELQENRTKADCARAVTEVPLSFKGFFGPPFGPLGDADAARLAPFFEQVEGDIHMAVWNVKDHFKRPRPFAAHKEIHPCVKLEDSASYPSGHAAISRTFARVLGELAPTRAAAFMTRADQIAHDRTLGGVHYPSDIEAGKALGDKIFAALMASAKFQAALAEAKAPVK